MGSLKPKNDKTPKAATNEVSKLSATTKELTMKIIAKEKPEFTIFRFGDSEIRVIDKAGDPWFVAKDVCDVLGISNNRDGIARLDEDEKGVALTDTLGGAQELAVVSESGMYTLVLRCRDAIKPGTVPHSFRKWVTSEVLPAIRKTGQYSKNRKTTVNERTPLRDAVNMLVGKKGLRYDDAYNMVHQRFDVDSIDELEQDQIPLAVEYIHRVVLDGEFIGKQPELPLTSTQFSKEELCSLCWLWMSSSVMISKIAEVEPLLAVAEHRLAGAYYSMPREYARTLEKARTLLDRETKDISVGSFTNDNWRVLHYLRCPEKNIQLQ